jgi:integrase
MKRESSIAENVSSERGLKTVMRGYASTTDTFEVVSKRFLRYQKARVSPAAYRRERGIVETHLRPFFGDSTKLAAIKRTDVQDYVIRRCGEVSPASIGKELKVVKHLLSLAVEWGLIGASCAHGVKAPRIPPGRARYLEAAELRTVLGACPEWLKPIVGFAVGTGMTRGEVLGLRWRDVDLKSGRVNLPATKKGDGRIVFLNSIAQRALASVSSGNAHATDFVFTGDSVTPDNVSIAFLRACRDVNICDFRFQDLRHTAASLMISQGADINAVADFLGHRDLRTTARYQHLTHVPLSATTVRLLDGALGILDIPHKAPKKRNKN